MPLPQFDLTKCDFCSDNKNYNKKIDRSCKKLDRRGWQTAIIKLAIASTIVTATGCHSSEQIPDSARSAFAAAYPGVSPVWETKPYGYEAQFVKDGIKYEVEFSTAGQWLETEYEVNQDYQFSLLVLDRVKKEYPGWAITKREVEITPQGKFYELEIKQGDREIELYFDERGNKVQNTHEDS